MTPHLIKEQLAFTTQGASPKNEHMAPEVPTELLSLPKALTDGRAGPELQQERAIHGSLCCKVDSLSKKLLTLSLQPGPFLKSF